MASTIPAPILAKMRPASLRSGESSKYFETLELMLEQIQGQTGVSAGSLTGVPSVVGVLSPTYRPEPDEVPPPQFITPSADVTTQATQIISCQGNLNVSLSDEAVEGDTAYIYNNGFNVTVSSPLNIIGVDGSMGGIEMMAAFRFSAEANAWVSLTLSARHLRTEKPVYTAADIDTPARSDVTYVIDGMVDMGNQSIIVGSGGISVRGAGFGVSTLFSSEVNHTMFVNDSGGAGNIDMRMIQVTSTGSGSKCFGIVDHNGNSAVELNSVNFIGIDSLGFIDGYRQLFGAAIGIFSLSDGLEFRGSWAGGAKVSDLIVRGMGATSTLLKAGSGFTMGSRLFCDGNIDLPAGTSSVCDFSESNLIKDNLLQITNAIITRGGQFDTQDANFFPNISENSVKSLWKNNSGVNNTIKGGFWAVTTESATTVAAADTLYKLEGVTAYKDLVHFSGDTDNTYKLESDIAQQYDIDGSISIKGSSGDMVTLYVRLWDDSESSYINVFQKSQEIINFIGPNDRAIFNVLARATVDKSDRIELWVSVDASNDVTMESGSSTRVKS